MRYLIVAALMVFCPVSAFAKWYEASSDHFVVYANDREKDITRFSQQLEQYHAALVRTTGMNSEVPSPSNRLTVFVVNSPTLLNELDEKGSKTVGGFYLPRAGRSIAIIPKVEFNGNESNWSRNALMHEYAHHFMISNRTIASPKWLAEGEAMFFSSAKFIKDGSLSIGRLEQQFVREYSDDNRLTVEALLNQDTYEELRAGEFSYFYGKSWLLYHYLSFSEERRGQLNAYTNKISAGLSSIEAAREVFGSLELLEEDLKSYRSINSLDFATQTLKTSAVRVRELRKGEAKIMNARIRFNRGVSSQEALEFIEDVRKVESQYPNDSVVLAVLAQAEFELGNYDAAIVAADKAIAVNPLEVNAYIYKGYTLFRQAIESENPEEAYRNAFSPFLALNKIENDHPLPLLFYYQSFYLAGMEPPEIAMQGLDKALELAPFDFSLRLRVVLQQMMGERWDKVKLSLLPIAVHPHAGRLSLAAKEVLDQIELGDVSEPRKLITLLIRSSKDGLIE